MKWAVIISMLLISCSDETRSRDTLEKAGYSNIKINGYDPFSCGKDDSFSTEFTAENPKGETVTGTVCCGLLKGCTIRF